MKKNTKPSFKVVVVGIGGVGGYFGGRLCLNKNCEITFVCRGKHKEVIEQEGLLVKSIYGDFYATPNRLTDNFNNCANADVFLLCVKNPNLKEVVKDIVPLLKPSSLVIPLQNGVNNNQILENYIPKNHLVGGLCKIISYIQFLGVIKHTAYHPQIIIGELHRNNSQRLLPLQKLFNQVKVDCIISENINIDIWKKYIYISTISIISAITNATIGEIRSNAVLMDMMHKMAEECRLVAISQNIQIEKDFIIQMFKGLSNQDPKSTTSLQRDICRGNPSELDAFNGHIIYLGEKNNISTHYHKIAYNLLIYKEKHHRKNNSLSPNRRTKS